MKEMITVEKEVYDAVLRNSVRVNDLEAENQHLKELLKECNNELKILRMLSLPMASKEALSECEAILTKIDNAIGGKI